MDRQEPEGVRLIVSDLAKDPSQARYAEGYVLAEIGRLKEGTLSPSQQKHLRRLRLATLPFASGKANLDAVFDDLKSTDDLLELGMGCDLVTQFVGPEACEPHCRVFWELLARRETPAADRLKCACVLASLDPDNPLWQKHAAKVADSLASGASHASGDAIARLKPVAGHLEESLRQVFLASADRSAASAMAAEALAIYYVNDAADQPERLHAVADLLLRGTAAQQVAVLERIPSGLVDGVGGILGERVATRGAEPTAVGAGAAALLRLQGAKWDWSWLQQTSQPDVRSVLIDRIPRMGIPPRILSDRLAAETDGSEAGRSLRQALVLSLGGYPREQLDATDVARITPLLEAKDAGEQAAAQWALARLRGPPRETRVPGPASISRSHRDWWMDQNGHRMVAIVPSAAATFWMGAQEHEKAYAAADEPRYRARIERPYAISATETTAAQMERFIAGYRASHDDDRKTDDKTDANKPGQQSEPASFVTLLEAMGYCNWLSRQEGIPEDQWCYPQKELDRHAEDPYTARDPADIALTVKLSRSGYRLPTEVEWEYACRAGTESSRHFGSSTDLLAGYAYHRNNSPANTLWPVGGHMPSHWGLFDMLGNVAEWCHKAPPTAKVDGTDSPGSTSNPSDSKRIELRRLDLAGIVRGGSLHDESVIVRSSYRILVPVNAAQRDIGFRVARTLPGE